MVASIAKEITTRKGESSTPLLSILALQDQDKRKKKTNLKFDQLNLRIKAGWQDRGPR